MRTCAPGVTLGAAPFLPELRGTEPATFAFEASIEPGLSRSSNHALGYRVRLENTSGRPFRFLYCPLVREALDSSKGQFFTLNCHPVGVIDAHGNVVFEMRYRFGGRLPSGSHTLRWSLVDGVGNPVASAAASLAVFRSGWYRLEEG